MMVNIAAIEKTLATLRRINVAPTRILMRPTAYREWIAFHVPGERRGQVRALLLCGLPVVVTEDVPNGLDFAVSVVAPLVGPWADARLGAE